MNNNKLKYKTLTKHTKFATFDSGNEDDILLELLIVNLINNGASLNELMKPTELIENKKDREEMKTIITNIILDFINLNPEFIYLINES
jgi:hypothetical protein